LPIFTSSSFVLLAGDTDGVDGFEATKADGYILFSGNHFTNYKIACLT